MQVRLLNKSSNAYDTIDIKKLYKALSSADVVNDNIVIDGTHYELNSIQEDKFLIKGSIANADTNPDYPAAKKGDIYQITTIAGKVGGASGKDVDINDFIVCLADAVTGNEATVGTSWGAFERNIDLSSLISEQEEKANESTFETIKKIAYITLAGGILYVGYGLVSKKSN